MLVLVIEVVRVLVAVVFGMGRSAIPRQQRRGGSRSCGHVLLYGSQIGVFHGIIPVGFPAYFKYALTTSINS
jgi:hypothetical protein